MQTLRDVLAAGPLSADDALVVAAQLAAALRDRHAAGTPHRGVGPGRVLVERRDGHPVATLLEPDGSADAPFLAPEQWRGGEVGPAADVYAVGGLLVAMVRGAPLAEAKPRAPAPPAGLPRALAPVVAAATADDPSARPSAPALLEALAAARTALGAGGTSAPRKVALVGVALAGLGLVLLLGVGLPVALRRTGLVSGAFGPDGEGEAPKTARRPGEPEPEPAPTPEARPVPVSPETGRTTTALPPETGRTSATPDGPAVAADPTGWTETGRGPAPTPPSTGRTPDGAPLPTGRTDPSATPATGRTGEADPADTGRSATTQTGDTGRTGSTTPEDTGRTGSTTPEDTGRTGATTPADTGRTGSTTPEDTGRTGSTTPADTGRTGSTPPEDTGRTGSTTPADTGRTGSNAPEDTGRTGSTTPEDTGRTTSATPADTGRTGSATPADTGRTGSTTPADTGRTGSTTPADTGRTGSTTPADTGRTTSATPTDTGRTGSTTPDPTGRTGSTTPADTGRTGSTTPADTGRTGSTTPADTGRTGSTTPADTGRTGSATPTDTGRAGSTTPADTGRAGSNAPDPTGRSTSASHVPSTGRTAVPPGYALHVRPDGSETLLVRIPGGPVVEGRSRIHVEPFWIEIVPVGIDVYARFLVDAQARGRAARAWLPAQGPSRAALEAHLDEGAPLPREPLGDVALEGVEAYAEWAGLEPLDARQRRRAREVLTLDEWDVRAGRHH